MMNILIIEDEPRAARQLQSLLDKNHVEYLLLDVIDSIKDAINWFNTNPHPDLVFLDIQLADGLSFEIFNSVQVYCPIIFTTAFDQYAIQAFKVNSVDYLLKPIQAESLSTAMSKLEKMNNHKRVDKDLISQLLSQMTRTKTRESILVKQGKGMVQLKVNDLCSIYTEDGITFGVTADKRHMIDETLDQVYQTLDSNQFFKINRSQIVAKKAILKIEPYFNHRAKLNIEHQRDQEFIVSRPKTKEFKEWMNT